ncbi:MAG TPA: exodeoxyribonuclease VII large subunit [Planctomycetota bacterium]|nr:exodeoxyribonuclease VII large subunit [Planctomycetota bacterium]
MTGSVELDQDGTNLLIRFPYREDLVATVKDLPGRRWDPKGKLWRVPAAHVELVYAALSRHLFDFAPEIPSLLAGTLGSKRSDAKPKTPGAQGSLPLPPPDPDDTAPALTISGLNARVRDGLRQQFPEAFWVVGEVVDFDKSSGRQHRFFQLVEKARGEPRALAAVEVALFGNTAERLLPRLASGDAPLTLRDGIEIRALVKIDLYVATGRYQVVVQDIDPSFTLGKLALTREQILGELRQKGLADRNRSLGFPVPALRIGVLTSPESDGWNDFLRHLQESGVGFDATLLPIKVQGAELKPSLLAGLAWFAQNAQAFDVLCIVRGGGSRTDLAWFDDRELAFAVARHPLKILVGIGHQRDQSVLDAIAHSEKTPTAVADLLVRGVEEARAFVRERAARLLECVSSQLEHERDDLARRARAVQRAAEHQLVREHAALARAGRDLRSLLLLRLAGERTDLRAAAARVQHAVQRRFEQSAARLEHQTTRQRLLDPRRVLARGYALARAADGRVLPSVAKLAVGQVLRLQFRDGHAESRVEDVHPTPHE